jgi:type II secretory pathway pseudopilin PulG
MAAPELPADAVSWKVTRIRLSAKTDAGTSGESRVQLQLPTTGKLPSGAILEEKTLLESTLVADYEEREFVFASAGGLSPQRGLCLVVKWISGGGLPTPGVQYPGWHAQQFPDHIHGQRRVLERAGQPVPALHGLWHGDDGGDPANRDDVLPGRRAGQPPRGHGPGLVRADRCPNPQSAAGAPMNAPRHDIGRTSHDDMSVHHAQAFTLVEAVIATVIVGVMFVAALNTVGASRLVQHKSALASRGRLLAESLMAEILQQSYSDPDGLPLFGCEPGESTATRAEFDDVDDYHGWTACPLTAKDGTVPANAAGWRHSVAVEWIDRLNPAQVQPAETNAKRITVTVSYKNVPQATWVAIKTASE